MGLSVREFATRLSEDPSVVFHIETGARYPARKKIKRFAPLLSLTPKQLDALIAVERRGLDPNQMLPEISPAPLGQAEIERQVGKVLIDFKSHCRNNSELDGPIAIEELTKSVGELCLEDLDFAKDDSMGANRASLYGCFYPENFHGKSRVVLVNTGRVNGRRLSPADRRVTIAHELGHYFLHYGASKSRQLLFQFSKEPTYCRHSEIHPHEMNLKEYQANVFGACLLMPKMRFKDEWAKAAGDKFRLARHFDVTEAFVCLRAKTLGLHCE
jgi:hypothetical protein